MSPPQVAWDEPKSGVPPQVKWDEEERPGFFKRAGQSLGIPTSVEELESAITPTMIHGVPVGAPGSGIGTILNYGKNLYEKGKDFIEHPGVESAIHAATATTPGGGSQERFAEDAATHNFPGAAGTAAGTALQLAAPEIAERAAPLAGRAAGPIVRGVVKTANAGIKRAPIVAGAAIGGTIGKELGIPGMGASVGAGIGSQFPLKLRIPGEEFGLPKPIYPGANLPEHPGIFPGASLPATPSPEILNPSLVSESRTMPGQISPEVIQSPKPVILRAQPIPARTGLALPPGPETMAGSMAKSIQSPIESTPTPKATLTHLERQINDALGGKPLQRGAPIAKRPLTNLQEQIRESVGTPTGTSAQTPKAPLGNLSKQIAAAAHPLPEGFTPVESSVVKGYKYEPESQQLTTITNSGQTYTHAEVTPEEFKTFEAAKSKGTAWNKQIRANHVQVEKNGQPTQPIAPRSASPTDSILSPIESAPTPKAARAASSAAASEDLTPQLQKSVDAANAKRAGVPTTVNPAKLTQRWGVDESSITDTDANTRGMNAKQSKAYIDKLAKAYKEGKPVEPVTETRDANNNLTSVDGRHRALAAQKAGIGRIPIIVRRTGVQ